MDKLTGKAKIKNYDVEITENGHTCTCKDWEYRHKETGGQCKHIKELHQRLAMEKRFKG
ncbi:MAG: SWIM zinc finger family protein [Negativicutes bacterium]|nr:SWIM zinc finger family protein [Negativicutes bacterium]